MAEAAEVLGVHGRQVRNLIAHSQLDAERVGRAWLVDAASVDAYLREQADAGRPLSAESAWRLLARVDAALHDDLGSAVEPADRRDRYRLRKLQQSLPNVEQWSSWLRRRAERRAVWFHRGARNRIAADRRVERPDLGVALGLAVSDLGRLYVDGRDFEKFVAQYHGQVVDGPADDDAVLVMVVPELPDDIDWRTQVAAAALVDLSVHPDARVRHAALGALREAADALAAGQHEVGQHA